VITWPEFLVGLTIASGILLVLSRSLFRAAWSRLVQTLVFVCSVCFLLDYPAETRALWHFPRRSGIELLETPIENQFFIAACATDLLIVYLSLRRRYRDTTFADEREP
jgi:hypothetical protein